MPEFELWTLVYMGGVIFVGAVVRGFTGFGSSMIWVSGLTLVMPPAQAVPLILLLEVPTSLILLPGAWRQVEWRTLWPLFGGALLAAPLGVVLLAVLPATAMQGIISVFVLAAAIALWRNAAFRRALSLPAVAGVGVISGILTGATSAGGPPVILFYLANPAGAAIGRASLIVYFMVIDAFAAAVLGVAGLVTWETLIALLLLLPPMAFGALIGNRHFLQTNPDRFRLAALVLLAALAGANLARVVL